MFRQTRPGIVTRFVSRVVSRAVALAVGTSLVTGCGERAPASDSPYGEIVARVVPQLEQQLGLPFKTPPRIETRSREEVKTFVMAQLSSERGRTQIEAQQGIYRILGLIPDTMDLGGLLQRLLEEQIIGYYDPATKVLYVVEGAPKAMLEQTVAHELVHALQDQYIPIDSIQKMTDDADRQSAAQSILEGQAVFQQLRIDPNIGPMLKMPGGWDRIRDAMRDEQTGMPIFSSAPRAVREGLLFPYLGGADFVRRYIEKRPEKELLTDLPVSSRQILNDAAYFTTDKAARDVPVAVTLPQPGTGTVTYSNNFGEFETRLILVQHIRDEPLARRAASGIDGDRYALIRTAAGEALVWVSVWDSSVDAADFLDVFGDAMRRRYDIGRQDLPAGTTSRTLDAPAKGPRGARRVSLELRQLDGRDVVIFVDAPAAAGTKFIDPTRITFGK